MWTRTPSKTSAQRRKSDRREILLEEGSGWWTRSRNARRRAKRKLEARREALEEQKQATKGGHEDALAMDAESALQHREETQKNDKRLRQLMQVAQELVTTEETYVDGLRRIVKGVMLRIKKYAELGRELLTERDLLLIFSNIEVIFSYHEEFLLELQILREQGQLLQPDFLECISKFSPFFSVYTVYTRNFSEGVAAMRTLRAKRKEFQFFMNVFELSEECKIHDLMILPIQRLPRYILLLKSLDEHADPGSKFHVELSRAILTVSQLADNVNQSMHMRDAKDQVMALKARIEGMPSTFELSIPSRFFVREGQLLVWHKAVGHKRGKKGYGFLFNDLLVLTSVPKGKHQSCRFRSSLMFDATVAVIDWIRGYTEATKRKKKAKTILNVIEVNTSITSLVRMSSDLGPAGAAALAESLNLGLNVDKGSSLMIQADAGTANGWLTDLKKQVMVTQGIIHGNSQARSR